MIREGDKGGGLPNKTLCHLLRLLRRVCLTAMRFFATLRMTGSEGLAKTGGKKLALLAMTKGE